MKYRRVILQTVVVAVLAAAFVGVWWVGATVGNHLEPWGIVAIIIAIAVMFVVMLRDE